MCIGDVLITIMGDVGCVGVTNARPATRPVADVKRVRGEHIANGGRGRLRLLGLIWTMDSECGGMTVV